MLEHILIESATKFDLTKNNENALDSAYYDKICGYWVDKISKSAWINNPNRPKPTSKKCDIETGEDKK